MQARAFFKFLVGSAALRITAQQLQVGVAYDNKTNNFSKLKFL